MPFTDKQLRMLADVYTYICQTGRIDLSTVLTNSWEEMDQLANTAAAFLDAPPVPDAPVWPHEPTWYIHRLLEKYGLEGEEGWGDSAWDEENVISALENLLKGVMKPIPFIKSMHTLIKADAKRLHSSYGGNDWDEFDGTEGDEA